jgi:glycerol kinase
LAAGIWGMDELTKARKLDKVFKPGMEAQKSARLYKGWKKAVARSMSWMDE